LGILIFLLKHSTQQLERARFVFVDGKTMSSLGTPASIDSVAMPYCSPSFLILAYSLVQLLI